MQNDLIHDWNQASTPLIPPGTRVLLNDETLRDGLQNPSVHDPSIEEKIEILHLMESLGIDSLNIGLPGAGPRAVEHTEALAREIATNRMKIRPNAAARTVEADIRPIAEISQRIGIAIEAVVKPSGEKIRVDWHGHNDRGLAIANSLWAVAAGAHCVHAAANSLGERVGNTPMELMLVNLRLMGLLNQDLSRLKEYCEKVAKATHTTIPPNYPVIGRDAFRTATGVHAAAIIKAYHKQDAALANAVYSGVPSHLFGLDQIIEIGPMSGKSNVLFWLERHGIPADDALVTRIFDAAKQSPRVLTESEVQALCSEAARNWSRTRAAPR